MPSLVKLAPVVLGSVLLFEGGRCAILKTPLPPTPTITLAPGTTTTPPPPHLLNRQQQQEDDPDAITLAQILLTAIPTSLRQLAATNVPAASSILHAQFENAERPAWFVELPEEIQRYLIGRFGPDGEAGAGTGGGAWPTEVPGADATTTNEWTWPSAGTTAEGGWTSGGGGSTVATAMATFVASTRSTATASSNSSTLVSSQRPTQTPSPSTPGPSSPSATPSNRPTDAPLDTTPDTPPVASTGLSKSQKIGLGVGIPFGILGAAALFLGCCMWLRRRRRQNGVDGSMPPSSPGFIPRFAFHERPVEDVEHRTPLNRDVSHSMQDAGHAEWEDEGVESMEAVPMHDPYAMTTPYTGDGYADDHTGNTSNDSAPIHHHRPSQGGMSMYDPQPIMAPALFHTHSSNRARGMRTSYTSLHMVAEVTEPDEMESPVLGRRISPKPSPARNIMMPTPPIPAGATIKRKPVSMSPPPVSTSQHVPESPAAQTAARTLSRQMMPEHSGSSSSGLALSIPSGLNSSNASGVGVHEEVASPVSPLSTHTPSNPFQYDSYVEDYGPEYQGEYENGLYGGHTSLSSYPEPRRKSLKTEWPLRNLVGSVQRRKSGPLWDRIHE